MSSIYCYVESCKHRSKRRSTKKNHGGEWLYRCTKGNLVLVPLAIGGGEEVEPSWTECLNYEEEINVEITNQQEE